MILAISGLSGYIYRDELKKFYKDNEHRFYTGNNEYSVSNCTFNEPTQQTEKAPTDAIVTQASVQTNSTERMSTSTTANRTDVQTIVEPEHPKSNETSKLNETNIDHNPINVVHNQTNIEQNKTNLDPNLIEKNLNETNIDQNKIDLDQNKTNIEQNKIDLDQNKIDLEQNKTNLDQNKTKIEQNKSTKNETKEAELDKTISDPTTNVNLTDKLNSVTKERLTKLDKTKHQSNITLATQGETSRNASAPDKAKKKSLKK